MRPKQKHYGRHNTNTAHESDNLFINLFSVGETTSEIALMMYLSYLCKIF
jgi:hypothetical protein